MLTADQLRNEAYKKYLNSRNVFNLTDTDRFEDAYSIATDSEKDIIENLINNNDLAKLAALTNKILGERQNTSIKTLRRFARLAGIQNWHMLSKASLLSALKNNEHMFSNTERYREVSCT